MDRKLTNPTNKQMKMDQFLCEISYHLFSWAAYNKLRYNLLFYLTTTSQLPALQPDLMLENRIENLI